MSGAYWIACGKQDIYTWSRCDGSGLQSGFCAFYCQIIIYNLRSFWMTQRWPGTLPEGLHVETSRGTCAQAHAWNLQAHGNIDVHQQKYMGRINRVAAQSTNGFSSM